MVLPPTWGSSGTTALSVIASAAKQSRGLQLRLSLDCFAVARNDRQRDSFICRQALERQKSRPRAYYKLSNYPIITTDMMDPDQRRLLGDFVRAHRERLSPEAPTGRRRTPGMRREELAAKAGMSATWCAWIEPGREVQ